MDQKCLCHECLNFKKDEEKKEGNDLLERIGKRHYCDRCGFDVRDDHNCDRLLRERMEHQDNPH